MPLLLLLLLYLACITLGSYPRPFWIPDNSTSGPLDATLASWAALTAVVAVAGLRSWQTCRRLRQTPMEREAVVRSYVKLRFYHLLAVFAAYLLSLYVLGWGWAVQEHWCQFGKAEVLPGAELLLILPLVLTLLLSWFFFYDAERTLHETGGGFAVARPFWKRSAYVGFHARQNLALVLLPFSLLVLVNGANRLAPDFFREHDAQLQLGFMAFFLGMLVCMPWVFRLVLGLESMPGGPLRDRLQATAERLNFRVSDIMVWNTRLGVANALVVGLFPFLRYVALSDRLLADLSPDELDAVLGHEAGHVKHRHMLYYLGFFMTSLLVGAYAWTLFMPSQQLSDLGPPVLVGSLGTYVFVVFGFLSRRCERQADIFGCRAVSCGQPNCAGHAELVSSSTGQTICPTGIHIFIGALEKVAALNGISRSKPGWLQSWQHSTIDRRVDFLQQILADPTVEARFQRRVGLVKWALMVSLLSLLALLWSLDAMSPAATPENTLQSSASSQLESAEFPDQ